ncbi:RNA/RNP complex-1-interacting phosphatase-like [Hydractinia symbiolongicarpus]|uniref:RNA/RNP complex-1-interacting phosphatase-like n=1 Tax=Hydractinia symbiolongicarpus TaxID=13093 RepID=UPI00254F5AEE|nr:RNA/RNP complex-1-interacting phosphatase-like [Hydractinia symbiolongicarpus]
MPRNKNKARIPSAWKKYSISGKPIGNTQIICIKTPVTIKHLTPEELLSYISKAHGCKLGLIIDLTDTNKYYNPQEFVALNIVHYKIQCKGMQLPSEDIVEHFNTIVSRFVKEHHYSKKHVAVHCLTGVNRTGYLVCRYLMDVLKWDAVKAINTFQNARGHNLEHENLINALIHHKIPPDENSEKKKCILM